MMGGAWSRKRAHGRTGARFIERTAERGSVPPFRLSPYELSRALRPLASRPPSLEPPTMHLRFTTAGESHGKGYVAVVEGLPAGLPVSAEWVDRDLARRMMGYGRGARMKIE